MSSSQPPNNSSINFSITSPFRNVRLVEITDEILEVIERPRKDGEDVLFRFISSPPMTSNLTKSSNTTTTASKQKEGILHLCSEEKVWAVKQVSTSNSVYLLQPSPSPSSLPSGHHADQERDGLGDTDMDEVNDVTSNGVESTSKRTTRGMTAIAQMGSFLELHPSRVDEHEVEEMIRTFIPVYQTTRDTDGRFSVPIREDTNPPSMSIKDLQANIPAPMSLIHKICSKICLFETTPSDPISRKSCYIASPKIILDVWSNIVEACSMENIKLDQPFTPTRLINALDDPTETEIATPMLKPNGHFHALGIVEEVPSSSTTITSTIKTENKTYQSETLRLKPQAFAIHLATLILQSYSHPSTTSDLLINEQVSNSIRTASAQSFINHWSSLLPTSHMKHCTLDTLVTSNMIITETEDSNDEIIKWIVTGDGTIRAPSSDPLIGGAVDGGNGLSNPSSLTKPSTSSTTATTNKRKWHEKFGAQRDAKRSI